MKKKFYIRFFIKGIGTFERWGWYASLASFVKAIAEEYKKDYPRLVIFVKVLDWEEIKPKNKAR